MTDVAGTPDPKPDDTKGGTPEAGKDDSGQVTVSAQFKKEALENWKPAAEERNQLRQQLAEKETQLQELARRAYGGQAATDPRMARLAQLQEQAAYDPVAAETLELVKDSVITKAESWLSGAMLESEVPKAKRDGVASLIRASNYQMSVEQALSKVTDPDSKTLAQQLADTKQELDRLKNAKPNGASPAAAIPANSDASEGRPETMKMSEYTAVLQAAAREGATESEKDKARALKLAAGTNKLKIERQ